jgi:hypothetical protein
MEQKQVCISLTASQLEALNSFARKQNDLTELLWKKMVDAAIKAGLIKIVEKSQKSASASKPQKPLWMQDAERIELLEEFASDDEFGWEL